MTKDNSSDRPLPIRRASQLTPRTFDWLWLYRLAFGKLSMLDGDAGEGKSLVALDLCARLSTGQPMPDGSPGPGVVNSLIIQDEDGGEDTVICRLQALGADCERISIWTPDDNDDEPFCTFSEVRAEGRRRHIAIRTLSRAAKDLGVRTRHLWRNHAKHTYWLLKGQCIPTASPGAAPGEFDRYLADIERQRFGEHWHSALEINP